MGRLVQTASGWSTTINDETGPLSEEETKPRMTHAYYCDLVYFFFEEHRRINIDTVVKELVKYLDEQYQATVNDDRELALEPEYYI